ncbi:MAG: pyridoxal-dependent decarboxylase [Kineosporiaceae bacterium]
MTPEEFRAAGHRLVDWIADFRTHLPDLPVGATVRPGEVAAGMPPAAPRTAASIEELLVELDRLVVPGTTHVQHPRYAGWFPANASLASVLGDLASTGIGALGLSWQSAPALTEVEEVVCAWLATETGLPPGWRGSIHDTASTACLVALLAARERASTAGGAGGGGLQAEAAPLVVYTTEQAHSSVAKAARLAGFGADNLRLVPTDSAHAMDVAALAAAMDGDAAAGRRPAAVVASVGSTGVTAIDPVAAITQAAAGHGAWVHVDAAMAGSGLLLPELRHLLDGDADGVLRALDAADSLSWNPHKWMGTALDCSLLYLRDPSAVAVVMSTDPSYLRSGADGQVTQFRDWGIPLGRRFRALKLWFHLHLDGLDAIRARLRRDLANAAWLAEQVAATPGWRVLAPVRLQTVCVRHEPPGLVGADGRVLDGGTLDLHTQAWAAAVNASGAAFVTPALLDGHWMVRVSVGAETMEREDLAAVWAAMREAAQRRP